MRLPDFVTTRMKLRFLCVSFFLAFTWKNVLCHPKLSAQPVCSAKGLTEHSSHLLQEVIYMLPY